jgi:predicted RNA-binding protein with PIN domain
MKDLYIIDGYNFIFNIRKPAKLTSGQLSELREKLLVRLSQFKSYNNCSIIAVFDARHSENPGRSREILHNIDIIYSRKGETADSVVENIVHNNQDYERVFVVTSDNLQQKVIFRENIYRKSIREFSIEMNQAKEKISNKLKQQKNISERSFYLVEKRIGRISKDRLENLRQDK